MQSNSFLCSMISSGIDLIFAPATIKYILCNFNIFCFIYTGQQQPKDFIGLSSVDALTQRIMFLLNEADFEVTCNRNKASLVCLSLR